MADIFVSIGLDRGTNQYPEIDKIITRDNLRAIAIYAAERNHRLIVRDHPAVTAMLQVLMGENNPRLVIVPEDTAAEDIAQAHSPDVVFYIAGNDDVAWDFTALTPLEGIRHVPLPGTGGAAEILDNRIAPEERTALDGGRVQDIFGFDRIARVIGPPPLRPRRGPQPL